MTQIVAIAKREFNSYFKSPMGWVLLAIYTFISGLYFSSMLLSSYADASAVLQFMRSLFMILIPLMTMRTISEDKKNGTEVLLATSPASTTQIVLGKYLGTVLMFLAVSAANVLYVIITLAYGGMIDIRYFGTLIAYLLTAFTYLAIGVFASALTENQIIAAVISFVIFVSFEVLSALSQMIGNLLTSLLNQIDFLDKIPAATETAAGQGLANALNWLNPSNRLEGFASGTFDLLTIIYFISMIVIFLYLTVQVMDKRRWVK